MSDEDVEQQGTHMRLDALGDREVWGPQHRTHVFWFEKAVAVATLAVATIMVQSTEGNAQYFFIAIGGVGVWKLFPSVRPFVSKIVDRMPILAKKGD